MKDVKKDMDLVFKALADATRRKLLDRLHADNGQTLGDLCARLDMSRQAVTKHLRLLETANLAKYQVLSQAGAAVLSSSNQTTQLVLQLLQKL